MKDTVRRSLVHAVAAVGVVASIATTDGGPGTLSDNLGPETVSLSSASPTEQAVFRGVVSSSAPLLSGSGELGVTVDAVDEVDARVILGLKSLTTDETNEVTIDLSSQPSTSLGVGAFDDCPTDEECVDEVEVTFSLEDPLVEGDVAFQWSAYGEATQDVGDGESPGGSLTLELR